LFVGGVRHLGRSVDDGSLRSSYV